MASEPSKQFKKPTPFGCLLEAVVIGGVIGGLLWFRPVRLFLAEAIWWLVSFPLYIVGAVMMIALLVALFRPSK
jgi:hypothetical protein